METNHAESTDQHKRSAKIRKSVVKLFVQTSTPNYCMPWQMKRQQSCTGSGFVISERRILTNAHVTAYQKSIRVRKHGDAKKYNAHILHVAHACDIAMVGVNDDSFWEDLEPLEMGGVPQLEEDVVVMGYPTGGDNISVTRGVVSRVDIQRYSHSGTQLLAIQIDAAINSGNSGGPALKDGCVVGVAFETLNKAENIGYIIPIPVINHFLEDIQKHEHFTGFCNLGISWQPIESEHMRRYFQMETKQTGVLVSKIVRLSCCYGQLKRGDVLMALDDVEIADDGTVPFRGSERILWHYLIHKKFPSDRVRALVYRAGEKMEVGISVGLLSHLVPPHLYDTRPSYVVYCGLVFVALSQPYMLHQYGKDWGHKAPIRLCDRILYGVQGTKEQEVVVLSQVLASELTAGYDSFSNLQLYRVNGVPILNLRHLCHLLDRFTAPYIPTKQANGEIPVERNGEITNGTLESKGEIITPDDVTMDPVTDQSPTSGNEYVSFNVIGTKEVENVPNKCAAMENCDDLELTEEELLYSQYTNSMDNLYHRAGDDPLLLDCTNFIHFELDKDKIAVFNIATAYTKNNEILKQYAITTPRSDNLPEQKY